MAHFNWLQLLPFVDHHYIHVWTGIAVSLFLILFAFVGRLALGSGSHAVIPSGKLSIKGLVEVVLEFIVGLSDLVIGEDGRKFVPMFASIFFFILINNLVGLIPGMTPSTDNLNTTIGVGLFSFLVYNFYGLKENGLNYLKHFMGPVLWLAPLMAAIEVVSHCIRPLTLGLRLQGNILADHTVLGVFVDMFSGAWFIPVPAIFYGMGIFVSGMQAFVFTMLSMIYISMAIAHDH
ncbi:MAG: ATP synthase F0 subunit A [Bdellovibrionaceae bacterium]|nr:ATP synthase F0 subunit A [Pseudobdellovibrionaceae bacterium]|tara:strand:+ start:373 stop:1074 length:702 start_codon:yes stop_codon:yes gene_type:complete